MSFLISFLGQTHNTQKNCYSKDLTGTQNKFQLLRIAFAHDDTSEICGTKNHAFMPLLLPICPLVLVGGSWVLLLFIIIIIIISLSLSLSLLRENLITGTWWAFQLQKFQVCWSQIFLNSIKVWGRYGVFGVRGFSVWWWVNSNRLRFGA